MMENRKRERESKNYYFWFLIISLIWGLLGGPCRPIAKEKESLDSYARETHAGILGGDGACDH